MTSLKLDEIQNNFTQCLTTKANDVCQHFNADAEFTEWQRLEVYRTNGRSLHVSVLSEDYPVCKKILGDDYFKQVARFYYQNYSSGSFDLNAYGDNFADYINFLQSERSELESYSYLSDLALLENAISKSHYAQDSQAFNINEYHDVLDGNVIFMLRPDVMILKCDYPVHELWHMHQTEDDVASVEKNKESYLIGIYRDQHKVYLCEIDSQVYQLVNLIKQGNSLGDIFTLLNDSSDINAALEYLIVHDWLRM